MAFLNRFRLQLLIQAGMGIAMFGKKHDATSILVQASDNVNLLVLSSPISHIIAFYKLAKVLE